jgi:hypothetical protein
MMSLALPHALNPAARHPARQVSVHVLSHQAAEADHSSNQKMI